jgi:F420-dependent oxidoreductase-like protein
MRIGLQLPSFSFPGGAAAIAPTLDRVAEAAEEAGFASLWVMDHFFQLPEETGLGGPNEPMLEAYTTLGYLARATRAIRLGPMVAGAHFRAPGVLLKAATTLDVLSGGRTYFAVGAGWYEREARGLGIAFPSRRERFELLEDLLRAAHHAWGDEGTRPFAGRHVRMEEPRLVPQPLERPRPRIMIGGGGERRTLRLVAQYADACNILVPDPGESRTKLEVLRRHCEELGRDYAEIEKTALVESELRPGRGSARQVVEQLRQQADEGIEHVIVNMPDVYEPERIETYRREIIPALAGS